jgi:hypothetical protein
VTGGVVGLGQYGVAQLRGLLRQEGDDLIAGMLQVAAMQSVDGVAEGDPGHAVTAQGGHDRLPGAWRCAARHVCLLSDRSGRNQLRG